MWLRTESILEFVCRIENIASTWQPVSTKPPRGLRPCQRLLGVEFGYSTTWSYMAGTPAIAHVRLARAAAGDPRATTELPAALFGLVVSLASCCSKSCLC